MTDDLSALLAAEPEQMSYEQARDGLAAIVNRLEGGSAPLEESLALWEKGEALAKRCNQWLDGAEERLAGATGETGAAREKSRTTPDAAGPDGAEGSITDVPF